MWWFIKGSEDAAHFWREMCLLRGSFAVLLSWRKKDPWEGISHQDQGLCCDTYLSVFPWTVLIPLCSNKFSLISPLLLLLHLCCYPGNYTSSACVFQPRNNLKIIFKYYQVGKIFTSLKTHAWPPTMWPCVKSFQSCPTLCDPMDCNPPGSSVHGILQARKLEWVSMPSFMGSFWPRDWTRVSYVSCIGRQILYQWRHLGNPPCDLGQVNSFCWASSPATLRFDSASKLEDLNKYCSLGSVCRGTDASALGLVQVSIHETLSRVFQGAARDANHFSRSLFFNWGS